MGTMPLIEHGTFVINGTEENRFSTSQVSWINI